MKVKHLIQILRRFDQESEVFAYDGDNICDLEEDWIYDQTVYMYEVLNKQGIQARYYFDKKQNPHLETVLPKAVILDI